MLPGMLQHGTWKGYYPNGKLNYTGAFVNGKKDGIWVFYDESGKKFVEQVFKAGQLESSRKL
jgi:antitoxin component YwqK of YwqJK toxin-antitoxin module